MSNFRTERAFVIIDAPIPRFDHLKAIDSFRFCRALFTATDSELLDLTPLNDFAVAAGDKSWQPCQKPRWHSAASGLKAVRGLLAYYQAQIAKGEGSVSGKIPSVLPPLAETLGQLETVLDKADTYDRSFYFALKDLP